MRKKQLGVSLGGLMAVSVVLIAVALIGIKLAPSYIEFFSIKKVINATASENKGASVAALRKSYDLRSTVDCIESIKGDGSRDHQGRQRRGDRRQLPEGNSAGRQHRRLHRVSHQLEAIAVRARWWPATRYSSGASATASRTRRFSRRRSRTAVSVRRTTSGSNSSATASSAASSPKSCAARFPDVPEGKLHLLQGKPGARDGAGGASRATSNCRSSCDWGTAKRRAAARSALRSWPTRWRRSTARFSWTAAMKPCSEVVRRTFDERLWPARSGQIAEGREDPPAGDAAGPARKAARVSRGLDGGRNAASRSSRWNASPRVSACAPPAAAPRAAAPSSRRPAISSSCSRHERRRHALRVPLRHGGDRRPAEHRQVEPAQPAGRPEARHRLAQGADHAPHGERHPHHRGLPVRLRRPARLPDQARERPEQGPQPPGDRRREGLRRGGVRGRGDALRRARPRSAGAHTRGAARGRGGQQGRPGEEFPRAAAAGGAAAQGARVRRHRAGFRALGEERAGAAAGAGGTAAGRPRGLPGGAADRPRRAFFRRRNPARKAVPAARRGAAVPLRRGAGELQGGSAQGRARGCGASRRRSGWSATARRRSSSAPRARC